MKLFIYPIFACILFILYVRYLESKTVFAPSKNIAAMPESVGLAFEDVDVTTSDGVKINGWFVPVSPSILGTLLFCHGNAGNIGDRLEKIRLFHEMGLNVFIFDYRGYGKSQGYPTEKGMYNDTLAAYDYLLSRKDVDSKNIIAYGASLGGAAAVDLATQRKLSHLIIDSSFTNAADMAKRIFPWIPSFVIRIKLDSLTKIKKVTIPKLFIHSVEDDLVPFELGKKLFDAAPQPKIFLQIYGTHNDAHIDNPEKFWKEIEGFLKR